MKFDLPFTKFQSTGNDFILIDARIPEMRQKTLSLSRSEIARICDRRFGVGGDGLILLLERDGYDFEMRNYNSDGGECTMCGNGARALVQFAHSIGIIRDHYRFIAIDGEHEAKIENGLIHVKMKDVESAVPTPAGPTFDTGSPHLIRMVDDLTDFPVVEEGRKLRNSTLFMPAGINVNFVEKAGDQVFIRTYERGVEDETLSCGTGVIAAALAISDRSGEVSLRARGGALRVKFEKQGHSYRNIWLIGPSIRTFEGIIREEQT
jgi:diaminopimelate epimerase